MCGRSLTELLIYLWGHTHTFLCVVCIVVTDSVYVTCIADFYVEQQRALSDSDDGSEDESKKVKVKVDLNEDHSKLVQMKHVSRLISRCVAEFSCSFSSYVNSVAEFHTIRLSL